MLRVNTQPNYTRDTFWQLADETKMAEKYRIDTNLQYLQEASLPQLQKIFLQYRFFTHYYITDLALLISKLPLGELRTLLAEILSEELGSKDANGAHPILYDDFLRSIGVSHPDEQSPAPICKDNLETIQLALKNKSAAYGLGLRGMGGECLCQVYLATMHHYFSQNPHIIALKETIDWTFWDIHIGEIDIHHQEIVRAAIDRFMVLYPNQIDDLAAGYIESVKAWDQFWKDIFLHAEQG